MDKPYFQMSDDELKGAHATWEGNVEKASGWASAYFAAKQVEKICREGAKRGLGLVNHFPIVRG